MRGERDPHTLAELKGPNIKSDKEKIAKALYGDYREEHLFSLKQEFELYKIYQEKVIECDKQIEKYYQEINAKVDLSEKPLGPKTRRRDKTQPKFDVRKELYRITGMDLTKIPGLDVISVQTITSETGVDMNRWPTEKHFTSWLGLSPANKITGEKVFSARTRKVVNRAATAFRLVAYALGQSNSALGAYYRRLKSRLGAPQSHYSYCQENSLPIL